MCKFKSALNFEIIYNQSAITISQMHHIYIYKKNNISNLKILILLFVMDRSRIEYDVHT